MRNRYYKYMPHTRRFGRTYQTKQECISRAYEIAADLPSYMPNYQALKYKCIKDRETIEGKIRTQWHMKTDELLYSRSTDSKV